MVVFWKQREKCVAVSLPPPTPSFLVDGRRREEDLYSITRVSLPKRWPVYPGKKADRHQGPSIYAMHMQATLHTKIHA